MNGFFKNLRENHPYKLGDYVEGKKVTATYYKFKNGVSVPYFTLDYIENREHKPDRWKKGEIS